LLIDVCGDNSGFLFFFFLIFKLAKPLREELSEPDEVESVMYRG
jgi:hypothetical protein